MHHPVYVTRSRKYISRKTLPTASTCAFLPEEEKANGFCFLKGGQTDCAQPTTLSWAMGPQQDLPCNQPRNLISPWYAKPFQWSVWICHPSTTNACLSVSIAWAFSNHCVGLTKIWSVCWLLAVGPWPWYCWCDVEEKGNVKQATPLWGTNIVSWKMATTQKDH